MGYLLFDGIVLLVLAVTAVQGYRKGLVLTLCGFLAVFVAFVGASVLSDALARPISQAIAPAVERGLFRGISETFSQAVNQGLETVAAGVVRSLAEYAAYQLTRTVLFVVCFVLVLAGWIVLSRALDLAFKLPVLSALNQWSGAAVGLIKGCVLLFIACWLLKGMLPQEAVDQSVLLHFFCTTNPFALIASVP